ncbi:MAG TPA: prolyl oligopeptidase family serine peptidase [Gemmatimonadales bacterium]|jgi:dipeptidyl aminopeptidase/acylaminoacyl peptidase
MFRAPRVSSAIISAAVVATAAPKIAAQARPTVAQFLSSAEPLEIHAARRADRIAWMSYDRGMRNVYTAVGPAFRPVRLTSFLKDDGTELTSVAISDDGSTIVFVRGSDPNRAGWVANPTHDPDGAERAIWAVRSIGGSPAFRVAVGNNPQLSPDGRYVLFTRDSQIFRAHVSPAPATTRMDTAGTAFIREWGRQTDPVWSPDGTKIAFVSQRPNHSLVGVYDARTRTVAFLAPSVDFDAAPAWSPDGKEIAFVRRPGTPFGRQTQAGGGGVGFPAGVAANPPGAAAGRGNGGGRGGRGGGADSAAAHQPPGLYVAKFRGGYTVAVMIADLAAGSAREVWHNAPDDRVFTAINTLHWEAGHLVFPLSPQNDEWDRYYSIAIRDPHPAPAVLTTTNGLIEDATSVTFSRDGTTLFYCTNAGDIERRHIWAVPVDGSAPPRQVSTGDGIETYPAALASGKSVAVIYADAKRPASIAVVPMSGGAPRIITSLPSDFPIADEVVPQVVTYKAPDGLEIHGDLFLPADLKSGERRPTIVFVHGGPQRQMMPGYHYFQFYHWAYAVNQWLASEGYVVLSINYRLGIGYGRTFRRAQNTEARGNSEYQDVLAGARYLLTRDEVDPKRIGIWGLSYGGLLTSQALARNSDIFIAGADLAGVHLYGNSLDTAALSYRSSAISQIDHWKSPVFLEQADDDRNVDFAQMVGLVQLLRAHDIYYDLTVVPDDVHELLLHSRWLDVFSRMGDFLHRFVWDAEPAPHVAEEK